MIDNLALDLAKSLTGAELDVLAALKRRGRLEIGDVPSKVGLRELLTKNIACQLDVPYDGYYELTSDLGQAVYAVRFNQ